MLLCCCNWQSVCGVVLTSSSRRSHSVPGMNLEKAKGTSHLAPLCECVRAHVRWTYAGHVRTEKPTGILEQVYRTVTKTQAVDEHGVRSGKSIEKIGVMSRPGSTRATASGSMRHFGVCVHFTQVCSVCLVCWRQLSSIWFVSRRDSTISYTIPSIRMVGTAAAPATDGVAKILKVQFESLGKKVLNPYRSEFKLATNACYSKAVRLTLLDGRTEIGILPAEVSTLLLETFSVHDSWLKTDAGVKRQQQWQALLNAGECKKKVTNDIVEFLKAGPFAKWFTLHNSKKLPASVGQMSNFLTVFLDKYGAVDCGVAFKKNLINIAHILPECLLTASADKLAQAIILDAEAIMLKFFMTAARAKEPLRLGAELVLLHCLPKDFVILARGDAQLASVYQSFLRPVLSDLSSGCEKTATEILMALLQNAEFCKKLDEIRLLKCVDGSLLFPAKHTPSWLRSLPEDVVLRHTPIGSVAGAADAFFKFWG